MVHWEHGLALVEGAQGQACVASGVSPCPHSCDLPGDTVLSLWLGNVTRCPLVVFSLAKAWRWALEGQGEALPVVPG